VNARLRALPPPAIALIAGALSLLSFAPFGAWPLQIASLATLFWLLQRESSFKRAALIGWMFGFGWIAAGVHWLYISMHHYGHMALPLSLLAVALLALALSGYAALAMGAAVWLRERRALAPAAMLLLVYPALWMLSEWVRGWAFTGFPWVASGYAHNVSPLAGFAPLVGVYGLGLLAAVIAGCLLLPSKKIALGVSLALLVGGLALGALDWTRPHGKPISVRLLQGNVAQDMKFDAEHVNRSLSLYYDMIRAAPADLIAMPETALPLLSSRLPPDYLPLLANQARRSDSHLIVGLPWSEAPGHYANSVLGYSPAAATQPYRYDKHHLVPFGEFIPPGFRWFVDMLRIPLGDFDRGRDVQPPFAVKEQAVLPNICYEDLFGEEIAAQLRTAAPATIMLNVSNIAWYDDSLALPQHLQISQMRALEMRRPMLRATNTGMTAVIGPKGKVEAKLPKLTQGTLAAMVQGYQGATPYIRFGNGIVLGLAAAMLAAGAMLRSSGGHGSPTRTIRPSER
jgi:apolipoprotein N-acyltransferase